MAPGVIFQSSNGGAFPMAAGPNLPRQDGAASGASSSAVSPAVVGAGVGVGVAILMVIIAFVVRIQIVRKRHQRAMAQLEQGIVHSPARSMTHIARPVSGARCTNFMTPLHGDAGWDTLYSNDTLNEPEQVAHADHHERTSVSLPKRIQRRSRQLKMKGLKHLSAIMEGLESPRVQSCSASPTSPEAAVLREDILMVSPGSRIGWARTADGTAESPWAQNTRRAIESVSDPDLKRSLANAPGSPRSNVLPSYAIKSTARYGTTLARNSPQKYPRSVSASVLDADGAVFGYADRMISNPKTRSEHSHAHSRSVSLGAPTSRPPSGPVPPIPVANEENLPTVSVSRESSSSSMNSAGSSVLVTSPILKTNGKDMPTSPTLERVVAGDDRAELKSALNRQWQNPKVTGPRPNASESALSNRYSTSSGSSIDTKADNRLSIPQIATAETISVSRVSSSNSLLDRGAAGRIQKIETPPRKRSHRVSTVSASGSPAARSKRRSSALREMSSNISGPAKRPSPRRQASVSTLDSTRSSNGNPFQWDTSISNPLPKPSAIKGSPNSKKSHRRHNCVRISALTPEVLGPSGSLSSSSPPGIVMDDILEERESGEIKREDEKERLEVERAVADERRRSRPPMPPRNVSNDSCLRVQTLRASLTPSSPTLSTWNSYQDPFDHPNVSEARNSSRFSNRSSGLFIIPKFPSPSKARASIAVTVPQPDTAPMPEFSIDLDIESPTLGFNDYSSSPFGLPEPRERNSPVSPEESTSGDSPVEFSPVSPYDMPSSPPLPISKVKEYDPSWMPMVVDLPTPGEEYDPASPVLPWNAFVSDEVERSSGLWLPFAVKAEEQDATTNDDSPPLSPKTVPSSIPDLSNKKSNEKLTSENASSMMGDLTQQKSQSSFLGTDVPVLAPSTQDADSELPQWQLQQPTATQNQRSISGMQQKPRPTTACAPSLPTIPQSSSPPPGSVVPEPLSINQQMRKSDGPMGPRPSPAKSVLKNAMALRRMNSAVCTNTRESRNFTRLGREPSPLLPWDVEFDTRAGASSSDCSPQSIAEQRETAFGVPQVSTPSHNSALDDLSLETLEKVIEGALAGFDAENRPSSVTPKASAYAYGQGYNNNAAAERNSNVWDDGEKFWSDEWRPESLHLPQLGLTTVTAATPRRESQTIDPKLLSTPMASVQATPRSLYDADGFLKG